MGVTGLWRLIEPAGKPVPVETLENKVLAVDISIWLHQVVKGYQDAKGAPLPNAHLMGLFQRLCKLLYFRIKPVFVFDGGFPDLKKETIAKRQDNKTKYNSESERLKREIALLLGKKTVLGSLLGTQISPKKIKNTQSQPNHDDIFKLPALPQREEESETDSEDEQDSSASTIDLHSVDIESDDFKNMPVKEKYDLLIELKDTRKMNSWGKLHTLPEKSDNFSDFQMQRLLKRRKVQECLQETEKEMGDVGMSLNELESFLNEEGIDTKIENLPTRRIASNNTTRFLLINNVQQALADAKKREKMESSKTKPEQPTVIQDELEDDLQKAIKMSLEAEGESSKIDEEPQITEKQNVDEDLEKAIKMSLECIDQPNTSTSKTDDSWMSYKSDTDCVDFDSDSEEGDGYAQPDFSTAKAYIMQYSDFTYNAIDNIVASKSKSGNKRKKKCQDVNEIIEELNHEKSVIVDKVHLSSGEDEKVEDIDDRKMLNIPPTLKVVSKSVVSEKRNNEVSETDSQPEIDLDMNMTQSSIVCIEKPDDVITLDASSDENLEVKDVITKPASTNHVRSENQSDTSDDDFEEVSEVIKPAVQVSLDLPDTIENDIFADVFVNDNPNLSPCSTTLKDTKSSIISDTENVSRNTPKLIKDETKYIANTTNDLDPGNVSGNTPELIKDEIKYIAKKTNDMVHKINDAEIKPDAICNKDSQIKQHEKIAPADLDKDVLQDKSRIESTEPSNKQTENRISTETINTMVAEIESEQQNLMQEKGRMDRIGRNITEQMTKEAQELLQIFGIPYIVAPMEAEAQCAFLESVNLTDGTITDDSDIWLFGGRTVYKNFFNQKKHVLQFLSERIEKSFNLNREQLILLALLVGSDYTTGVSGVGPVTALEILASFPFNKRQLQKENSKHGQYQLMVTGLQEFKTWVRAGRRTDNISLKKKLRNVSLGDDFPSVRVVQAYLEPNVEKSEDKFTWGELDITVLRDYAKAKFGWSQNKVDVILQPVIKRMIERKTQKTVQDYFKKKINFQSLEEHMSKRVKAAVQKMDAGNNGESTSAASNSTDEPKVKAGRKRKGQTKKQDNTSNTSEANIITKKKKTVQSAKVCTTEDGLEINIIKTDRYQEIITQREKDMQNILQNKLKAIEIFRKTKIDRKRKPVKKRVNLPKDKADLSESSDSN